VNARVQKEARCSNSGRAARNRLKSTYLEACLLAQTTRGGQKQRRRSASTLLSTITSLESDDEYDSEEEEEDEDEDENEDAEDADEDEDDDGCAPLASAGPHAESSESLDADDEDRASSFVERSFLC